MIQLAIKKILHNKVLMLSLFTGILCAIIIACTIPIYSRGIAHRMLVTQLENYQNEHNENPGALVLSCSLASFKQSILDENGNPIVVDKFNSAANIANFEYCSNYLETDLFKNLNMPALVKSVSLSTTTLKSIDARDKKQTSVNDVVIKTNNNYANSIEIIDGKMPSDAYDADECIEVMVSRATQAKNKYVVGSVIYAGYTVENLLFTEGTSNSTSKPVKLKVVGIFDYKADPYNAIVDTETGIELYCNYDIYYSEIFEKHNLTSKATWYYAGDYTKFDLDKIDVTIAALDRLNRNIRSWGLESNAYTILPPIDQYSTYDEDVNSVNVLLVLFYAPVMILIVFFIFMISKFVVENDKNEISMLNSRGASRMQVLLLYLIQGGAIALVGLVAAPLISLVLCNFIGASSGFLEFSQKAPIKLDLNMSAIIFCVFAALLAIVTMLIPVYKSAKVEIVQQKRNKNKKSIIGVILLAVSAVVSAIIAGYAYYVLVYQQEGLFTDTGGIQPLAYIFLISFFAAIALAFVFIYPLILKLIIRFGQADWEAGKYSAFSRISRLEIREKFIVIFLTLTIAIGAFASVSARTLNVNLDNTTNYQYPCDYIADVKYYAVSNDQQIQRDFIFAGVEGIEATKVIIGSKPRINGSSGKRVTENISLMGINPDEFKDIVIWDDEILDQPLDYYMSKLKNEPNSCIISSNAAEALGVGVGGRITVLVDSSLKTHQVVSANVIAVVDAWPAYYAESVSSAGVSTPNYLCVLNNSAIDKVAQNQEYSVWMNTDYSESELVSMTIKFGAQKRQSTRLINIVNGAREHYLSQINSVRQATNGSLTLGFVAVMFVCAVGFAIYWMISIKSRTLQIGTMRALGMSFKDVYIMILWEQMLLCLASVVIGVISGIVAGVMFAPLLQSAFNSMGQMPPYEVAINAVDIIKLLVLIIILIAISVYAAIFMLKRIKAASAIKLGEE